jgi:hypothetical protein
VAIPTRADRLTDLPAGLVYLVLATLPPAVPRSSPTAVIEDALDPFKRL